MSTLATSVITALRRFSNVVVEGPPGTGKTFVVSQIADVWQGITRRPLRGTGIGEWAITLHPSTSYEDMVEGMRYDERSQRFQSHPGFIRRVIAKAEAAPDDDFLVLLDEVNRANIPKVLGDMLMSMEHSKRAKWDARQEQWVGAFSTTLPYSGEIFSIPSNVYLLGTMNSSDRSIAPIDSALRRRFAFIRVEPLDGEVLLETIEATSGKAMRESLEGSVEQLTALNSVLRRALGPDAMLGHSYVFDPQPQEALPGLNGALTAATSAVWLEVRKASGAIGSQIDLSGSERLFYPLTAAGGVRAAPKRGRVDSFSILYEGNAMTASASSISLPPRSGAFFSTVPISMARSSRRWRGTRDHCLATLTPGALSTACSFGWTGELECSSSRPIQRRRRPRVFCAGSALKLDGRWPEPVVASSAASI